MSEVIRIQDVDLGVRICIFILMIISALCITLTAYMWIEYISGNLFKTFVVTLVNCFVFGITIFAMIYNKRADEYIREMENEWLDIQNVGGT